MTSYEPKFDNTYYTANYLGVKVASVGLSNRENTNEKTTLDAKSPTTSDNPLTTDRKNKEACITCDCTNEHPGKKHFCLPIVNDAKHYTEDLEEPVAPNHMLGMISPLKGATTFHCSPRSNI